MKTYRVSLSRAYLVTVQAENKEKASRYAEFYIGDCSDISTFKDKKEHRFSIEELKLSVNGAIDVEGIEE